MADNAAGFGATAQSSDNSDQIRRLLDQVQDLMIEDGADPATAEALTNYARPATPAYAGNLADLNRMGQVALQGSIDTPPGQADEETTNITDAFKEPPAPDLNTGLQTPMGTTEPADTGADSGTQTKADLQAQLDERGIAYPSSATKAELQALLDQ